MVVVRGLRTLSVNYVQRKAPVNVVRGPGTRAHQLRRVHRIVRGGAGALRTLEMAHGVRRTVLGAILIIAIVAPCITPQPPTADDIIEKDQSIRRGAVRATRHIAVTPKRGFFGTIFQVIVQQINDTKSAYTQISDLVNNQFADDNAVTKAPDPSSNGTTQTPKITRAEFLKILDRNLKGLNRLRNLEWREARKDSAANIRAYKDEIFKGKKSRN